MLWTDRAGRFSPLKATTLAIVLVPGLWVAYRWASDQLGGKPLTEAIHEIGEWTIRFLLATLAITPARKLLSWPRLILIRRMLGVTTMGYGLIHFALYVFQQNFNLAVVASEIALRFYLTIGFVALVGLVALGWTSTDAWIKRLGAKRWQMLHRAVYVIGALAMLHYALQLKIDVSRAVLVTGLLIWLLGYRVIDKRRWPINAASMLALTVFAALATAAVEALWYGIGTGIPARAILAANLNFRITIRPAWWVLGAGLVTTLLFVLRRWWTTRGAASQPGGRVRATVAE